MEPWFSLNASFCKIDKISNKFFLWLAVSISLVFSYVCYNYWYVPLNLKADYTLNVKKGDSFTSIKNRLVADKVITSPTLFKVVAAIFDYQHKVYTGEYCLRRGTTLANLFHKITTGEVEQYAVTIVAGQRLSQVLETIWQHPKITKTLTEVPVIEGMVLPETYHFTAGTTDLILLNRANSAMLKTLESLWQTKGQSINFQSWYEVVILASIIEKETRVIDEMPQISGVYHRRLQQNMRLQADPTIIYGLLQDENSNFDGRLRKKHLKYKSNYNTYLHKGLPPTPIAIPSVAALDAALHPDSSDVLYFVANKDGSHNFAATLQEHEKNIKINRKPS